jgi:hypothetical protein
MTRLRILFADDQIPDVNVPDDKISKFLNEQHPEWSAGFINAFIAMRQSVKILDGAGYDVTVARTYKDALKLIKHSHFDIAIVDLGWFADATLPPKQQEYGGWDICAAIDEADKSSISEPTLQIVYSNRFVEDASISMQAADSGKLPVFKNYKEATHQALRASVKFIETNIVNRSPEVNFSRIMANDFRQMMTESLMEPLAQQKQWSRLTLIFVAVSVLLILAGAASAIFWNNQVGTISSISSILTGIISSLFFTQLQRSQKTLAKNQEIIRQEYWRALERLDSDKTVKAPLPKTRSKKTHKGK